MTTPLSKTQTWEPYFDLETSTDTEKMNDFNRHLETIFHKLWYDTLISYFIKTRYVTQ